MPGFGEKVPSGATIDGKKKKSDPERAAADEVPGRTGLLTPGGTPQPESARLEADKARQQAKVAKAPTGTDDAGSSSGPGRAVVTADEGQRQTEYTEEQKKAVERVLKCGPTQYYRILGVNDPCTKEESMKAYKRLARLLHPDKNKYEGAEDAFKFVNQAAKALGVENEDFAENAYDEEDDVNDVDVEGDTAMRSEQGGALQPDAFHVEIYGKAVEHLGKLMEDPWDEEAKSEMKKLNDLIREHNRQEKLPRESNVIRVDTFVANFELALGARGILNGNPAQEAARKKLTTINEMLDQLNQQQGYPREWQIPIPPRSGTDGAGSAAESSGAAASRAGNRPGNRAQQTSTSRGGVKTRVSVPIPDESDGRTSLGMVVHVRKVGNTGSRVIVNRGTEENPYFEIHPGGTFGKGVAQEWLTSNLYSFDNLPSNITAKEMTLYGRVMVERTSQGRRNKTARTQSQITYYLIAARGNKFVSPRSKLAGMKGMSPVKLNRLDAQLDSQNEQLRAELDACRENNEHPDTGEQLTNSDIQEMPWLSKFETQDRDDSEDEDDDDGDGDTGITIPQRTGLKRTPRREPEH